MNTTSQTNASKPRCETVDQIVAWTTPDGALQIREGDLILWERQFEVVTRIGRDAEMPTFNVRVELDGHGPVYLVAPDQLVAVRRYVETTEE